MGIGYKNINSKFAIGVLENEVECFKRRREYDCDYDCRDCDLLYTDEEVLAAYEFALNGLKADIWLRSSDTPESVADALYEAIVVEDEARPCYTMEQLGEIAERLNELVLK